MVNPNGPPKKTIPLAVPATSEVRAEQIHPEPRKNCKHNKIQDGQLGKTKGKDTVFHGISWVFIGISWDI